MLRINRRLVAVGIILALIAANLFTPFKIKQVNVRLAPEPILHLGGFVITNTLLASWLAMALLIALALWARRQLVDCPRAESLQNILETVFEALYNFMSSFVGTRTRTFFPLVATFFLFILTSNWLALLPGFGSIGFWEMAEGKRTLIPLLRGSTTDLNTTIALALCSVISSQIYGIRLLGLRTYSARFIPLAKFAAFFRGRSRGEKGSLALLLGGLLDLFIGVLEIFEELTKVLSFSFRLFGNVFGGEVLLSVMAFLVPYVASIPFLSLELFGGAIQAFIFAILTTAFLGRATAGHQADEDVNPALAAES